MIDLLLRGGTVIDGTGAAAVRADVALHEGRVVGVGSTDESAARTVDLDGLVVAPGFVDIHTHYDAQLLWDPNASPSPLHGVTTVVGGNCGFSVAPLGADDADYVMRMFAVVEGIPLDALRSGADWSWHSFGDFLGRLEGHIAVNAGFLVGHSTLRRTAMGDDATEREATADELSRMVALLHDSLAAGGLGFSSSLDEVHLDGDGNLVPSRAASFAEYIALASALRDHPGTTLEFIPAVGEIPAERMDLMADMSLGANRPLNWNLLGSLSPVEIYEQQLTACDVAARRGAHVVALALPDLMRLRANRMVEDLPGFRDVVALPDAERRAALRDPEVRAQLRAAVEKATARGLGAMGKWDLIEIAETRSSATAAYAGQTVAAVAETRGEDPIDVLLDVVVPDRLPLTLVLPTLVPSLGASDEGWSARVGIWQDERVMLGGSDAGAHVDLMCHANYPTVVLSEVVRRRGLLSLEQAVRLMTEVPARLYGLRGRGRVEAGGVADLVVFDPDAVASEPATARFDLPGGGERLYADAVGIETVYVAGRSIVSAGEFTGDLPGVVLRSGTDTDTVTVPGAS
jgi:N-acyl-D-aspartate/D-glutamate deacylase